MTRILVTERPAYSEGLLRRNERFDRLEDKRVVAVAVTDSEADFAIEDIRQEVAADFGTPTLSESRRRLF